MGIQIEIAHRDSGTARWSGSPPRRIKVTRILANIGGRSGHQTRCCTERVEEIINKRASVRSRQERGLGSIKADKSMGKNFFPSLFEKPWPWVIAGVQDQSRVRNRSRSRCHEFPTRRTHRWTICERARKVRLVSLRPFFMTLLRGDRVPRFPIVGYKL